MQVASADAPVFAVNSAESTESIPAEKGVLLLNPSHHRLRPVYHRNCVETESAASKAHFFSLLDDLDFLCSDAVITLNHRNSLGSGQNSCLRISLKYACDEGRVVRLHVVDNEIVQTSACKHFLNFCKILVGIGTLYGVYERNLLICNYIGIVCDAIRKRPHAFEPFCLHVGHTDIINSVTDFYHIIFTYYLQSGVLQRFPLQVGA